MASEVHNDGEAILCELLGDSSPNSAASPGDEGTSSPGSGHKVSAITMVAGDGKGQRGEVAGAPPMYPSRIGRRCSLLQIALRSTVFWAVFAAPDGAQAELQVMTATEAAHDIGIELERAVARVDRVVFTFREVLAEARLVRLRLGGPAAVGSLRLSSEELSEILRAIEGHSDVSAEARDMGAFLAAVLAGMVQRELLMTEVRRLQLRDLPDEEVLRAYRDLFRVIPDPVQLRATLEEAGFGRSDRVGEPPPALARVLRAERAVTQLTEFRRALRRPISEAELKACFRDRRLALGGPEFDFVRPALEKAMRLARFTRRTRELLQQLQDREDVSYAPPFRAQPLPEVALCPSSEEIRREGRGGR